MQKIYQTAYRRATEIRNAIERNGLDSTNIGARLHFRMTRVRNFCNDRVNCPR